MNKHLAPVLGVVAVTLGVVGGVAGTQFLGHPAAKPAVVHLVQQAAQVVTPNPTTTTVAPAPSATATPVKVVKAVVAPAAPASTTSPAAQAPVMSHQAAVVAPVVPASSSSSSTTTDAAVPPPPPVPVVPCPIGSTNPGCGNHPGGPSATASPTTP